MLNPPYYRRYNILTLIAISILMFLLTANTLLPIPIDKVVIAVVSFWSLNQLIGLKVFNKQNFFLYSSFCLIVLLSFLANMSLFSFQILLPIVGLVFSMYLSENPFLFKCIYYGSFFHIVAGIILGLNSYITGPNDYVSNLAYKGVPFLNSAMGFTPTPQTYGTLCLTWLVMYFFVKDYGKTSRVDFVMYLIVTLGVFMAINRTSFLGYLLIIFFKQRKLFYAYTFLAITFTVMFWDLLYKTLFNTSTLNSRDELLEGFNKSFWGSNSFMVYMFGKADNKLADNITRGVTWDFRNDIENGFAMILHMYGFTGLTFYLVSTFFLLCKILKSGFVYECAIFVFFIYLSQYITQEFVATTFYVILGVLIHIYKLKCFKINFHFKQ